MSEYSRPKSFDFGAAIGQGFNLPGGKRYLVRVAAWSSILILILYAILGMPVVKAYVAMFSELMALEQPSNGAEPDAAEVLAVMAPLFKIMGLAVLIGLLQIAVFTAAETAIYRNLFHGEDTGFLPLRFGVDELRVLGTRIVVGFIVGGVYFGVYFIGFLIGALAFAGAAATGSGALAVLAAILMFALLIAGVAIFIWVAIKLAPASAYSVKHRAFNPVASWAPMKGLVWPAIGGFMVIYIAGYFIVGFVLSILFLILFLLSGVGPALMEIDTSGGSPPDFSAVGEQLSSAGFLIPLLIASALSLFLMLLWYGTIWSMWGYMAKDKEEDLWRPETFD